MQYSVATGIVSRAVPRSVLMPLLIIFVQTSDVHTVSPDWLQTAVSAEKSLSLDGSRGGCTTIYSNVTETTPELRESEQATETSLSAPRFRHASPSQLKGL